MIGRVGQQGHGRVVVIITLAISLVLMAIPLPEWAEPYRPDWLALVLVYWCLATPNLVGVGTGWIVGLTLDVLQGGLLGQNALAKTVLAFLAVTFHLRIRMFPVWQQAFVVAVLVGVNQALLIWAHGVLGIYSGTWEMWLPAATSMLMWPWVFVVLRDVRRYGGVG